MNIYKNLPQTFSRLNTVGKGYISWERDAKAKDFFKFNSVMGYSISVVKYRKMQLIVKGWRDTETLAGSGQMFA